MDNDDKDRKNESPSSGYNNTFFFEHMARMPWPYLVVLPVVFAILLGLGWSVDDKVEREVSNLWSMLLDATFNGLHGEGCTLFLILFAFLLFWLQSPTMEATDRIAVTPRALAWMTWVRPRLQLSR